MERRIRDSAMSLAQLFKIRVIKQKEHFLFNFLCFLYFRRSAARSFETGPVGTFIVIPYVFFSELYFFGSQRCFVTIGERIVGLVAFKENKEALFISILASHPFYRKKGVASFMLNHAVILARKLGKKSLELSVLKLNRTALKLYANFGFYLKEEKRRSYILQYQF